MELILGLFGLVNSGVAFSNVGAGTGLVLIGLIIGKPLGIFAFTWVATRLMKLEMPEGVTDRHIVTLGVVAGIGFTVALFVAAAAFHEPGPVQDAVKMGALGSFASAILAFPVAKLLGVKRLKPAPEET
ncbi:MAG: Na+/H+ antiporter NhaA [Planctomycetaceae bacterium]|nr:Na+/H+ antiporter NhaA [Planctomycetaceae bacterium]